MKLSRALLAAWLAAPLISLHPANASKPDVLLITVDELGYEATLADPTALQKNCHEHQPHTASVTPSRALRLPLAGQPGCGAGRGHRRSWWQHTGALGGDWLVSFAPTRRSLLSGDSRGPSAFQPGHHPPRRRLHRLSSLRCLSAQQSPALRTARRTGKTRRGERGLDHRRQPQSDAMDEDAGVIHCRLEF